MSENADPRPEESPGLEDGGQVPPGETPPAEGSTPGAGPQETYNPAKGWKRAPLIALGIVVLCFAVFFLAWAVFI